MNQNLGPQKEVMGQLPENSEKTSENQGFMLENFKKNIIKGLRYLRESKKWSYAKIGQEMGGYSYARVCELRYGKKTPKTLSVLETISWKIDVAVSKAKAEIKNSVNRKTKEEDGENVEF